MNSALYVGKVMHRRMRPRRHRLRYRIFSLLIDLDELPQIDRRMRLFSHNRFNLFSFRDADYGAGGAEPLRSQVERHMTVAGIVPDGGAIRLLTMPRILGYAFNPLSVYFCHRADGALAAILYEVNNTFGQRHAYFLPVADPAEPIICQTTAKRFHVSPFLGMALDYDFRVKPPGAWLGIGITARDGDGPLLTAALAADRRPLSDAWLASVFVTHPLMTLHVVGGILWEAARLWIKGVRVHDRPAAPDHPVTIARLGDAA